ncbi:extensin family protein [Sorangium atrum]|uniref:Extensin family protein n=1 Tax=Sorangium atrum TaxID=2995308 RepID=A0ABT5C5P9_9BACT|nr:extensin family protein [Sorangium aterium]MDC0681748.1 extensin family protein [Sorangium aterium]
MSVLPSRRALSLGAALIGAAALLTPLGIASLRHASEERVDAPTATAPAPPGAATALVDGGDGPLDDDAGAPAAGGAGLLDGGWDAGGARFELPAWSASSRAATYGALSADACDREMKRRGIPHAPARGAPLVDRPIRITGPLRGVTFRGDGVAKPRSASPFDIADCRLVLALDDLAAFLATRGIVEVVHFSMHRPGPAGAVAPTKAPAKPPAGKKIPHGAGKAAKPGERAAKKPAAAPGRPNQHALGLAIDVAALVKADGTRLDVKADWLGAIGAPPCGPGSEPKAPSPHALELREILCSISTSGLFNVVLTPNANEAHADHFHFDIKRDARYFLLE